MELIYYYGLNCHTASLVTILNFLDIDYSFAYYNLWSETDFFDDVDYNIFTSKRFFRNLKRLGIKTKLLKFKNSFTQKRPPKFESGDFLIIGMDALFTLWHPVFNHFSSEHFFFAIVQKENMALCFDPVYNKIYEPLQIDYLLKNAFEMAKVQKNDEKTAKNSQNVQKKLQSEAKAILRTSIKTKRNLLFKLEQCKADNKNIMLLLKQITAMINNRLLFSRFFQKHFVSRQNPPPDFSHFFNDAHFQKWEGIKNGLYKARILKDNISTLNEVYILLENLLKEERQMAKEILKN